MTELNQNQIHELSMDAAKVVASAEANKIGATPDEIISLYMATYERAYVAATKRFYPSTYSPFDEKNTHQNGGRSISF